MTAYTVIVDEVSATCVQTRLKQVYSSRFFASFRFEVLGPGKFKTEAQTYHAEHFTPEEEKYVFDWLVSRYQEGLKLVSEVAPG